MPSLQPLIEATLAEFQRTLRNTYHYKWETKDGAPPDQCYVEHVMGGDNGHAKGAPLAAWIVRLESIEPTAPQTLGIPKIDGMFFDVCRGFFSFTSDCKAVFVGWQTGPQFGRGFKHPVIEEPDGRVLLGKGRCLWAS